jgi:hypothetical protein
MQNLLSQWLLSRTDNRVGFIRCRKLLMNSTNFCQKILDYFISTISSWSFHHCEYRLCSVFRRVRTQMLQFMGFGKCRKTGQVLLLIFIIHYPRNWKISWVPIMETCGRAVRTAVGTALVYYWIHSRQAYRQVVDCTAPRGAGSRVHTTWCSTPSRGNRLSPGV